MYNSCSFDVEYVATPAYRKPEKAFPMQVSRKSSRESIGKEPEKALPMQISGKFSRESIGREPEKAIPMQLY